MQDLNYLGSDPQFIPENSKAKDAKDYLWVIGGGEMQIEVVRQARDLSLAVVCSDLDAGCACRPLVDFFFNIDVFDVESHLKAARAFSETYRLVGVLAAGIDAPVTMAVMARELGLPGVDPSIAEIVHDKSKFRAKIDECGFDVPKYRAVREADLSNLGRLADEVSYPLIVKNTDSSGSRATKIFYEADEAGLLSAAKDAIRVSKSRVALIESLWIGTEHTVETIFNINGKFHPCFITDRFFNKDNGYALEIGLRHPSALSEKSQFEMYDLAERCAQALGINVGAAKFDMMLTDQGPRIIEMTVRLSGGFDCQYLVPSATGKNIIRAAILTAIGKVFDSSLLNPKWSKIAISRSMWPTLGKIKNIVGIDEARRVPGVVKIILRKKIGDFVEPYIDCTKRVIFIIIVGDNDNVLEEVMGKVESKIFFEVDSNS